MDPPSDAVRLEPEPYESDGPCRVVAQAEAELTARYGGWRTVSSVSPPPCSNLPVARSGWLAVTAAERCRPSDPSAA